MTQVSAADAATIAAKMTQWVIGSGNGQPSALVLPKRRFEGHPERNYNMKGRELRKFLQHEKQTFGINLGWTDDATPQTAFKVKRWFFARPGQEDGAVRYGETVALGNGGEPSFVHHEHRNVGINLGWSDAPVFEWRILGERLGTPVKTNALVALFNVKADEFLIYFDRNAGGDIGWPSTKRWGDLLEDRLKNLAGDALTKAALAALA
jgi:hypothetical protein